MRHTPASFAGSGRRLDPLTSLRFVAALGVFAFHCRSLGLNTPSFAAQGVSFFFVLSGFILAYAHPAVPSYFQFLQKRIARVWPVHFLGFMLAALLIPSWPSWGTTLLNLLLLQAWIPAGETVFSFNAVSWSVSDELFFYLLFPFLIRARNFTAWLVGVAALTLAILITANRLWSTPLGSTGFAWFHIILQHPLTRFVEFVLGVGLGRLFVRTQGQPPTVLVRWPTLSELIVVGLVGAGTSATLPAYQWISAQSPGWLWGPGTATWVSQMGAAPVFGLTILVFAYGRGAVSRLLSLRAFVVLGEISYATYMLHQLVIALAERTKLVERFGLSLALMLVVVSTYFVSYLTWRWLEMPARKAVASFRVFKWGPQPTGIT